jgi:gamma-glutamylputrescine oxidase
MRQSSAYDQEGGEFSPPSATNERLTCDLLVAGGGLSGLSAAEAALRRGVDVIVIEKGAFGKDAASGLNAGQFLTGWAKPVDVMLAELAQQELRRGLAFDQARLHAQRRVRAFLRRTVEGCQRLAALDHHYNLRASVQHGAVMAAVDEADMAGLRAAYRFMDESNLRALMPMTDKRRARFFEILSAAQIQRRYGTAEGFYTGGVIDRFGGSFRPRKFLIGLARALQKRGVRFFQATEAQALEFSDNQVSVFCGNGANIRANTLFMANAYARHINGDVLERAIFEYDYVVAVELPEGAKILTSGTVLSDTREPCFYARRHGRRLYMGYEETPETSPEITRGRPSHAGRRQTGVSGARYPRRARYQQRMVRAGILHPGRLSFRRAPAWRSRRHLRGAVRSRQFAGAAHRTTRRQHRRPLGAPAAQRR